MSNYRSSYRSTYRAGYRIGAYPTESGAAFPSLWYDAQDIDLLGNTTMVDAQAVVTWKNKGTLGAAGDLGQGTGALRPVFRLVATSGKLNDKSAVQSDGTQWMVSPAFTTQVQPTLIAIVFRATDLVPAFSVLYDGISDHQSIWYAGSTGAISIYAGSIVASSQTVVTTTWETCLTRFAGTGSYNRFNGAQSAALNPGTGTLSACRLFTDNGSNITKGMIAEFRLYSGATPDPAQVESELIAKLGATPQ